MESYRFTTFGGVELTVQPITAFFIGMLRKRAEDDTEPALPVPTYELAGLDDSLKEFAHIVTDKTNTLIVEGDPEATAKNEAAWQEYMESKERHDVAVTEKLYGLMLCHCIQNETPPVDEWRAEYDKFEIIIPENEDERRLFWLKMSILTPRDVSRLIFDLMARGQGKAVSTELLDAVEEMFQHPMGQPQREAIERLLNLAGEVVGTPEAIRIAGGAGVGFDTA